MSKKKKPTAKRAKLPPVGTQWRAKDEPDDTDNWWEVTPRGLRYFVDGDDRAPSGPVIADLDKRNGIFTRFHSTYRKPEPEKLRHETTSTAAGWLPDPAQMNRVLRLIDDLTRRVQALEGGKR